MAAADPVVPGKGAPVSPQPAQAKATGTAAASEPSEPAESPEERLQRARGIVRRNVYWTLGIGLVPFPIIDFVGITAVELKLIKELADAYGVKFSENTAKSIISSLAVSIGALGIAEAVGGSLLKLIPVIGQIVGIVGVSVIGGAFTQALGNVFIMHFESGGTLLNFNPEKMRAYFQEEMEKAKETVAQMQKENKGAGPTKPVA